MFKKMLFAGVMLSAVAGAAHAASIPDGSFENLGFQNGQYVYGPTGSPWSFVGAAGETGNASAWGFQDAPDGTVVAFLQNISSISQTLTGLVAGTTYDISFDLAHRPNYSTNPVALSFDGSTIFSVTPTSDAWTTYQTSFTATGTSGLLSFFTATPDGDHDSGLDNVQIVGQTGAVPEPASWALMVGGFGIIGGAMRARRKTALSFR